MPAVAWWFDCTRDHLKYFVQYVCTFTLSFWAFTIVIYDKRMTAILIYRG